MQETPVAAPSPAPTPTNGVLNPQQQQRPQQRPAPGVPAYIPHHEEAASSYTDTAPSGLPAEERSVEEADAGQQTPFDRFHCEHTRSLAQSNGENKAEQSFWQKLIAGLRHFFGFETA